MIKYYDGILLAAANGFQVVACYFKNDTFLAGVFRLLFDRIYWLAV